MKTFILLGFFLTMISFSGISQSPSASSPSSDSQLSAARDLFESDDILNITLKGDARGLLNNRSGEAKYFPMMIRYTRKEGFEDSLSINVKTRGHFRRIKSNCEYPPLLLDFGESADPKSLFSGQSKLKLSMPCQGEEFVVHEWMVYKLYNLLTPLSYRARLVKVTLEDNRQKRIARSAYGILLEDDKKMAARNNMILVKRKMKPQHTFKENFLRMAVFEYLIGNTDWSVEFLQNINLLAADSLAAPIAVPHDFDLAGIVNSPYALPAEELQMSSVQERRYRGYCVKDMKDFDTVVAYYNLKKKDIYALYSDCKWLDAKYIKSTLKYFDEFYSTINNRKIMEREFGYPCDPSGTGNVILKGLKD
jgi:hypothetical protein